MHGLTVSNTCLEQTLAAIAAHLDQCWWYLGGAGMSFPWIRPPRRSDDSGLKFDPVDWDRYLRENEAAAREYGRWLDNDSAAYRVGKPGFFSRYSAGMEGDWKIYYASDAAAIPLSSFDEAAGRFDGVWFDPPPDDLPADICLITRDIDHAYLDLFFRDDWMFRTVWGYLLGKEMRPARFEKKVADESRRR
jgi:hypothetical protein